MLSPNHDRVKSLGLLLATINMTPMMIKSRPTALL